MICPIAVKPEVIRRDALFMVGVTAVFVLVGLSGSVKALEGGLMVALLLGYIGLSLWQDKQAGDGAAELHREAADELTGLPEQLWVMLIWTAVGFAAVLYGADLLVSGAVSSAKTFHVSDEVIGIPPQLHHFDDFSREE